jgi:hypothetical protein
LLLAALLPGGCAGSGPGPSLAAPSDFTTGFDAEVTEGFARVRTATAWFMTLDSAVAAGYTRDVAQCFSDSHHGAMGYHHVNRALLDARVEIDHPEILLYERRGDRYALNGVEYIVPFTRWPPDSVPPTVMGQPLKQSEELKLWYLHMWVWTRNPAGLFADWNPDVRCPNG